MFDLTLPNSLIDWIDLTDNKFLRKPELKVKIVLADNPTLLKTANNFQKEFYSHKVKSKGGFETFNSKCAILWGRYTETNYM